MPTRMPLSRIILTKDTPLSECWYSVSWKKMTPPRQLLIRSSALKRICRNCRRFSSVFSTPTWASRFAMLPVVNILYKVVFIVYITLDCCSLAILIVYRCRTEKQATDPQTHLQPGCPSQEKLYVEQSRAALSSVTRRAMGTGASSSLTYCLAASGR